MLYGVGLFAVHVSTQSQNPEELPDGTEVPDGISAPRGSHPSLTVVDDPSRRTASRRLSQCANCHTNNLLTFALYPLHLALPTERGIQWEWMFMA